MMRKFKAKKRAYLDRAVIRDKATKILAGKNYDILREIGTGAFGDVLGLVDRDERSLYAAKIMDPKMTSDGELSLWPTLHHPAILPVLEIVRSECVDIFLMPYHPKCLKDVLEEPRYRNSPTSLRMVIGWTRNVLSGLEYLHTSGVCHLDVKIDNILISEENCAVLCDFSSVTSTEEPTDKYVLPIFYRPPEAWPLEVGGLHPNVDGVAFDIWSEGILMHYVFAHKWLQLGVWGQTDWWNGIYPLIFESLQMPLFRRLMQEAFPNVTVDEGVLSRAMNLLKGVLRCRAVERPSASRILEHVLLAEGGELLLEPDKMWSCRRVASAASGRTGLCPVIHELLVRQKLRCILLAALKTAQKEQRERRGHRELKLVNAVQSAGIPRSFSKVRARPRFLESDVFEPVNVKMMQLIENALFVAEDGGYSEEVSSDAVRSTDAGDKTVVHFCAEDVNPRTATNLGAERADPVPLAVRMDGRSEVREKVRTLIRRAISLAEGPRVEVEEISAKRKDTMLFRIFLGWHRKK